MILEKRAAGAEMMDEPDQDPEELAVSLRDLRGVNRWLGGTRLIRRLLAPMIRRVAGPVRVLDVGSGSGDVPLALASWGRGRGTRLEVLATDFHPRTVELAGLHTASDPDVRVEAADARSLPYPDGSFSFALCATALHHFEADEAVRALAELGRVASAGVVVTDLRRSLPGLLGAELLARTVWRGNPVTRHDGPLSVRRAFTGRELAALAERAGLRDARVRTHPLRVSLVVDRTRG